MKTLSGTFVFVVAAVVAVVAFLGFRSFAAGSKHQTDPHYKFTVLINPGPDGYLEIKNQNDFDSALIALENHGEHHIKFLCKPGDSPIPSYNPHPPYNPNSHPECHIRTAKVTKSEGANIAGADASAANDPNAVNRLLSNDAGEINAVLITFQ